MFFDTLIFVGDSDGKNAICYCIEIMQGLLSFLIDDTGGPRLKRIIADNWG